jgi:hypothetical protein
MKTTSIITIISKLFLIGLNIFSVLAVSSVGMVQATTSQSNIVDFDISTILENASGQFKQTRCGISLASLANFVAADDTCPSLFLSIADFISNVDFPSIDPPSFTGPPQVTFVPPTVPDLLSFESVCSAGACIPTLSLKLADIDENCFDVKLPVISEYVQKQLRLIRAFTNVLCTRDDSTGSLCVPMLLNSFIDIGGLFQNVGFSARDTFCSSCSINFQREILSALDMSPNFSVLSKLACLSDSVTGAECSAEEIVDGMGYVATPSNVWNMFFDEEDDLCSSSSCATMVIGITTSLFDNKFPSSCYETIANQAIVPVKFAVENSQSVLFMNDDKFREAMEKDLSVALGLPQEYFVVGYEEQVLSDAIQKQGQGAPSSLVVTVTMTKRLKIAPMDNIDAMTMIENSPFTNLNSEYGPKLGSYTITTNFESFPSRNPSQSNSTVHRDYVWTLVVLLFIGIAITCCVRYRSERRKRGHSSNTVW